MGLSASSTSGLALGRRGVAVVTALPASGVQPRAGPFPVIFPRAMTRLEYTLFVTCTSASHMTTIASRSFPQVTSPVARTSDRLIPFLTLTGPRDTTTELTEYGSSTPADWIAF